MSATTSAAFRPLALVLASAGVLLASACRDAKNASATSGLPIAVNANGANGCSGPNAVLTAGSTPATIALTVLQPGPKSQITAVRGAEMLYATGANGTVVQIDVSGPAPVETQVVSAGTVATLLMSRGVTDAPELGSIAVLDASTLIVMEHTSNVLLAVERAVPDSVGVFAGQPDTVPGFADGLAVGTRAVARFSFTQAAEIAPSGDSPPRVFVCDPGNHAVRVISGGFVQTLAGHGTPAFQDGNLSSVYFDTPVGLTVSCNSGLVVSEKGGNGFGHRLRFLAIGASSPFGGFFGSGDTIVGTGITGTTGGPQGSALVSAPEAPFTTAAGELYWIDSGTGVLRRLSTNGNTDCPLAADCATAVATPSFPPGHVFSLTETDGGKLYVLDATAGTLSLVTP